MKLIDYFPVGKDSVQENYKKLINFTTSNVLQSVYLFAFCWETFFMRGLPKVFVEKDVDKPLPFGFALLRFVIGPENSHHSLHQSDSKLKPIATWSHAFSRASGSLLVFALSFPWLFEIFLLAMISLCDGFGFG